MDSGGFLGLELTLLLMMIALNGVFAMSEIAIVSARRTYLQKLEQQGHSGASAALELAQRPSDLLSTVQIGITLIGFVSGVFSGAKLVAKLTPLLISAEIPEALAQSLSTTVVIIIITFLSVIFGELIPKRFALHAPEQVACWVSRPVLFLSKLTSPLIKVLSASTEFVC